MRSFPRASRRVRFAGGAALSIAALLTGRAALHADLNGDGHADAVFANLAQPNRIALGDGAGAFTGTDAETLARRTFGVALGDVNGDGELDIALAEDLAPNRVLLGYGSGSFVGIDVEPLARESRSIALGDVNGDGHLDALVANWSAPNRVLIGDGSGGFVGADAEPLSRLSYDVALGDLNGDGYLDAVFANWAAPNRVLLGDGVGGFTGSDAEALSRHSLGVALGDLNADGDLDVLVANHAQPDRVLIGDGAGGFSVSTDVDAATRGSYGVAIGHLNADGHLDAIIASDLGPSRVLLGDGTGAFATSDVEALTRNSHDVALADVNGDGLLDAVFANRVQPNRVLLGDGLGAFFGADLEPLARATLDVALVPTEVARTEYFSPAPAPARGFLTPTLARAANDALLVQAALDFGGETPDLSGPAVIEYGSTTIQVPDGFTPNRTRSRWSHMSADRTVRAFIFPPRGRQHTSRGRLILTARSWVDVLPAYPGGGEALRVRISSGAFEAECNVQILGGIHRRNSQLATAPPLALDRVAGILRGRRAPRVALTATFAGDGMVPGAPPTITLRLGEPGNLYEVRVPSADHRTTATSNGYRYTLPGSLQPGAWLVDLDLVRRRIRLHVRGEDVGSFAPLTAPFYFSMGLDGVEHAVQVQADTRNGSHLRYH